MCIGMAACIAFSNDPMFKACALLHICMAACIYTLTLAVILLVVLGNTHRFILFLSTYLVPGSDFLLTWFASLADVRSILIHIDIVCIHV